MWRNHVGGWVSFMGQFLIVGDKVRVLLSSAEGITTARHRFGPLSRFLDWCQDAGHIAVNPCALIGRNRRPKAPQARSHCIPRSKAWEGHRVQARVGQANPALTDTVVTDPRELAPAPEQLRREVRRVRIERLHNLDRARSVPRGRCPCPRAR
jgi:hypothetical protein